MAWTAPRTFIAGELETAAIFNTHLRDNLKYLKGQAGTVAIEDAMTVAGIITPTTNNNIQITYANSGAAINSYLGMQSTNKLRWAVNRNPNSGTFDDTAKSEARIELDGSTASSNILLYTAAAANTQASERMRIDGSGNVGIGTTAPQGMLHCYKTIAGCMFWEYDGLDGTARTVIPNAAGDVVYSIIARCIIRSSGGTVQIYDSLTSTGLVAPGGSFTPYAAGADNVTFAVNANGAVTVQRTGGSLTYKVSLFLQWI